MAKKKQTEEVVVMEIPVLVAETSDKKVEIYPLNGKGIGAYYDETTKRYVVVTLDLSPEAGSAIITSEKVIGASKMAAILTADVDLKKLLEKTLK